MSLECLAHLYRLHIKFRIKVFPVLIYMRLLRVPIMEQRDQRAQSSFKDLSTGEKWEHQTLRGVCGFIQYLNNFHPLFGKQEDDFPPKERILWPGV